MNFLTSPPIYGKVSSEIGTLNVFFLSAGDSDRIKSKLKYKTDECDPIVYLRLLSEYICYPESTDSGQQKKPEAPILTAKETSQLSESDLETISNLYLRNNQYLLTGEIQEYRPDETIPPSLIKYPKEEAETTIHYLHRLCAIQDKKDIEAAQRFAKSFASNYPGFTGASLGLSQKIQDTFSLGERLKASLGEIKSLEHRTIAIPDFATPKLKIADFDLGSIARIQEQTRAMEQENQEQRDERNLKPIHDLGDKTDILIGKIVEIGQFTIEANQTQTKIAEALTQAGKEAKQTSDKNIRLTWVVITITACSVLLPVILAITEAIKPNLQEQQIDHARESIVSAVNSIGEKIQHSNKVSADAIIQFVSLQTEINKNTNQQLKELSANQDLLDTVGSQAYKIFLLEKQINELKKEFNKGNNTEKQPSATTNGIQMDSSIPLTH